MLVTTPPSVRRRGTRLRETRAAPWVWNGSPSFMEVRLPSGTSESSVPSAADDSTGEG